ncbi:MAG: hypothetical protein KF694_12600 [Mesorhizobium sp.]|nr:hypothetical protein [Mesorhizobium sp.]
MANIVANMFQLLNRGVPLRTILKGAPRKTSEISFYVKQRAREVDLEADLRAATGKNDLVAIRKLETEIQSIKDSYRRLSIWPLIDAGEFSAISNGQVTAEDLALADGKWTNWVERKINNLPNGLKTIARYGLVTRDTALYQGLARSVQYGDFVAKAILYDDLAIRKKMDRKEAIAAVSENLRSGPRRAASAGRSHRRLRHRIGHEGWHCSSRCWIRRGDWSRTVRRHLPWATLCRLHAGPTCRIRYAVRPNSPSGPSRLAASCSRQPLG